jgi:hypothetical protein
MEILLIEEMLLIIMTKVKFFPMKWILNNTLKKKSMKLHKEIKILLKWMKKINKMKVI